MDKQIEEEITYSRRVFHNVSQQLLLRKIAKSCSDVSGIGLFGLYECVMILQKRAVGNPLMEAWGDNFEKKFNKLKKIGAYLSSLNHYWMTLDKRKLDDEKELSSPAFLRYRKLFVQVACNVDLLYEAFFHCLDKSDIQHLDIVTEYWDEIEKK